MKFIFIVFNFILICILNINNLYGQENTDFNIGYYDLNNDVRYDIWGVHPVDIRSNTNQLFKRPIAGAELGLKDIKPFQRMAKVKFKLLNKRIKENQNNAELIYEWAGVVQSHNIFVVETNYWG